MLFRLLKKVTRNYGIFLSLLVGILLSLVIINCTVIYGNSLKDSLLEKVFSSYEKQYDEFPGIISVEEYSTNLSNGFSKEKEDNDKSVLDRFGLEYKVGRSVAKAEHSVFWEIGSDMSKRMFYSRDLELISIKDFKEHVDIIQGRMYEDTFIHNDKKIVEVVVDQKALLELKLEIDGLYRMEFLDSLEQKDIMKLVNQKRDNEEKMNYFKVVGVYKIKENDSFWRKGIWKNEKNNFVADENVLGQLYNDEDGNIKIAREYFMDFSRFRYSDRIEFLDKLNKAEAEYSRNNSVIQLNIKSILDKEDKNFNLVANMLWIIQIPVFAIMFLYILMITGIIVDRDKDEIALLKSRGATKWNILVNYLFDGSMILIVGLISTPILSMIAVKYMSTTSGFLEFKNEYASSLYFTRENIYFSIITGVVFLGALIIPVLKAANEGIVNRKRSKVRIKFSSWRKTFIDFILMGIGIYGFNLFTKSQSVASDIKVDINFISLDPVIFISATVFAFGLSLFFLRIYPYIILAILKSFKQIMPAHQFVLFSNLGRKAGKREYTMLFIMVMICSSIFNLKIARTINTNVLDNVKYTAGAEIKITGPWKSDKVHGFKNNTEKESGTGELGGEFDILNKTELVEPDYSQYQGLETLENTAKVMKINNISIKYDGETIDRVDAMAVEPKEFGEVAYMRDDLMDTHWYNYLNVIANNPKVIFLSSSMRGIKGYEITPGETIEIDVFKFKEYFVFGGYIDYWPGYENRDKHLLVGNFDYFYSRVVRVPYEVWGSLKEGQKERDLLKEIEDKSVEVVEISSISEFIKENIFLKAVNSAITISFILSMIVTLLGFMIYWCICIKERELQFGILRSLGLKIGRIYSMIIWEQILVTGTSLIVGIGIGQFISSKFLPVIAEIVFGNSLTLPIYDYIASSDYFLIIAIFIISVIFVLIIILRYISTIKICQAVKIGED